MRKSFFETLTEVATEDDQVIFLTADLGFGFVESYINKCPSQFLNIGVSEQAMLGLANGLAISGRKVICYSIAAFSLVRPFEFFRNGAIAQNSAVMVVGVGPGFDYSQDGISHYCLEDLAIIQSQPGVSIQTPFTTDAVHESVTNYVKNPKPTYLRLPRNVGQHQVVDFQSTEPGSTDVLIYCTALMARRAHQVSDKLRELGFDSIIGSTHEISGESDLKIIEHIKCAKSVLVIEDHYEFGGIGTRINELVSKNQLGVRVVKDAVIGFPSGSIGDFAYMEYKLMNQIEVVLKSLIK
jgi:transketolase